MTNDPTIDEIRRIRHEISRDAGHDLHRLKKTFELLESQFARPPVDHGGRRIPLIDAKTGKPVGGF
ncbi:MAG: hypothetical protein ACKVT0_13710 [Planctomycetaceae bacterium]